MDDFQGLLLGGCFVCVLIFLGNIEDWIKAWKAPPEKPAPGIDDDEYGYNEAAGWLLYGHSVQTTQDSLITTYTSASHDEGVYDAIRDWQAKFPNPKEVKDEAVETARLNAPDPCNHRYYRSNFPGQCIDCVLPTSHR